MRYVADFETTTDPEDCRVWAWGVGSPEDDGFFTWGKTIDDFFKWAFLQKNPTIFFHNLKFDGEFLLHYLFRRRLFLRKG